MADPKRMPVWDFIVDSLLILAPFAILFLAIVFISAAWSFGSSLVTP